MNQLWLSLDAAWKVLLMGLLVGAGLPALFALALRQLAWANGEGTSSIRPHPIGKVIAYLLFAVVILAIALGIAYITAHGFGYSITFDGLMPIIKKK